MQYVVDRLDALLPSPIAAFLSKSVIRALAQNVFDPIDAYAKKQLDKVVDKITK